MADIIDFKPRPREDKKYVGPSSVEPLYPNRDENWSEAHKCFLSELKPLTDKDHHMFEVADVCGVLEARIEDESGYSCDIEFIMEELVDLGETQHPYIQIARAYVALLEDDGDNLSSNLREEQMDHIKPIRGKSHTGRLAHFVLLLDAQKHNYETASRVSKALLDHGEDDLIHYKCKELASGNEFLEKLVEKYS